MDGVEKIDILNDSPEHFSPKKVSDITKGLAGSSSDSGSDSDSDSDSSDSGSDSGSHSRSKSRSPVGSQSGSSSDSDSDASSSSKQASDEDVDIMTSDDDKESKHKLPDSDPVPIKHLVEWSHPDNESVDIGNYEKQDDHASDVVDIEKDSPEHEHVPERPAAIYEFPNKEGDQEIKTSSINHHEQRERQFYSGKAFDGPDSVVNDSFNQAQTVNHERLPKAKSKRRHEGKHSEERTHSKKKLKSKNLSEPVSGTINSLFGESPYNSSPDRPLQSPNKGAINVMGNITSRDGTNGSNSHMGFNQLTPTRPVTDSQPAGQRLSEARVWSEAPSGEKLPGKRDHLDHGAIPIERSLQTNEGLWVQKVFNTEAQSEDGLVSETRPVKFFTEGVADKHATTDSHYRKPEILGKVKEGVSHSNSYIGYSPKDNNTNIVDRSPPMNGRGAVLRREYSDLELGELREPSHEDTPAPKKQSQRKNSFKQLENKPMDSEYWNLDSNRGKPPNKITAEFGKLPPLNSEAVVSGFADRPSKRKAPEHYVDDLTGSHHKSTRHLDQHHQSWGDHIEAGYQHNKVPEMSSKSRFAEAGTGRGASLESYGDTSRKPSVTSTEQPHDPTRVGPQTTKESKKQKPNMVRDSNDRRKDASLTGNNDGGRKKKELSSDDNILSYTKYEKEEPELKGPIKNASQ